LILNEDDIENLTQLHTVFKAIQKQYGNPPSWQRPQGFESLCKIILEQQVSLASAEAHYNALKNYVKEFTPENILQLTAEECRSCFVSKQKASYLKALSEAILTETIHFERHEEMTEQAIRKELIAIKGIGEWTADVYLMMCLQQKDIFPIGDIALQQAAKKLFAVSSREEILEISKNWAPLRSLASYFLWHWYLCSKRKI
jgi:DNA-3-methyladenine glycosylase II